MRALLFEKGIVVNATDGAINGYNGWVFLPNRRVYFEEEESINDSL